MQVIVSNPHGYCEGVVAAINLTLKLRKQFPHTPIDVLGMLVHNEEVIKQLDKDQITTINIPTSQYSDFLAHVPADHLIVFTAHGHDEQLDRIAHSRGLNTYDATCTKVTLNFNLITSALDAGREVIYIGKSGHPEAVAALARGHKVFLYDTSTGLDFSLVHDTRPLIINQTTLSMLELKGIQLDIQAAIPGAEIGNEVCSATRLRQQAVQTLPSYLDAIYVIGSPQSSNTTKLAQIAKVSHPNAKIRQIKTLAELDVSELAHFKAVGVASGASTPPEVTKAVIDFLKAY